MKPEFMDKLRNDPELKELRRQYHEIGECMSGYHYEEYRSLEDYKETCRAKLTELQKKHSADQ